VAVFSSRLLPWPSCLGRRWFELREVGVGLLHEIRLDLLVAEPVSLKDGV